jgi:WhiB family redox-sensing transcriptional regulator
MSTSSGYQPKPTTPVPTGMHQVVPNRGPSIVAVRQGFEATFGAYVPPDWTLDAECTRPGTDPALFYPSKGGSQIDRKALSICAACPVREECLEDAIAYESGKVGAEEIRPEAYGVRGGMVAKDRRRLIQQRNVAEQEAKREAAVADYVAGLPVDSIMAKHHVAQSTVTRWAKEAGVQMRPKGDQSKRKRGAA